MVIVELRYKFLKNTGEVVFVVYVGTLMTIKTMNLLLQMELWWVFFIEMSDFIFIFITIFKTVSHFDNFLLAKVETNVLLQFAGNYSWFFPFKCG